MSTISLNFNDIGKNFIFLRKKGINQFKWGYPFVLIFTLFVGVVKLGTSLLAIFLYFTVAPVHVITIYKWYFEPKKILKYLITNIEFTEKEILYSNGNVVFLPDKIQKRNGLQIFETIIYKYYILEFNSRKYYLIPDFFDDFNSIENRVINSSSKFQNKK
jgi:hypothetical protein